MHFLSIRAIALAVACVAGPALASASPSPAPSGGALDLRRAIELALDYDPAIKSGALAIEAAEGRKIQAGLSPNPEAAIEIEDSLGTGGYRGFSRTQTTLQISQLFELGGKLDRRVGAAGASRDVARADRDILRLDVMARTADAFISVLNAQRRLGIAEDRLKRATALVPALRRQIEAGASPKVEVVRGQLVADLAKIEVGRARTGLETARRNLASQWGALGIDSREVAGSLDAVSEPPPLSAVISDIDRNPRLLRWSALATQRTAELGVQRSLATPDITVGVGPRRYSETNDTGVVFSLTMPLPVNNRNQGGIIEARKELEKTGQDRDAARSELYRALSDAYGDLVAAWDEIRQLQGNVLPAARDALRGVQAGYGQGRFGVIDLLDVQGTLSEAESRHGDALAAYHRAVARIEGLKGRPLTTYTSNQESLNGQ